MSFHKVFDKVFDKVFGVQVIVDIIFRKLIFIERLKLCNAYPTVYAKIQRNPGLKQHLDFSRTMIKAFNEKGLPGKAFNDVIRDTNAIVSGSFVLKALTGDSFHSNDIDVYSDHSTTFKDRIIYNDNKTSEFAKVMYEKELFHCKWKDDVKTKTRGLHEREHPKLTLNKQKYGAFRVRTFQYTPKHKNIEPYNVPKDERVFH